METDLIMDSRGVSELTTIPETTLRWYRSQGKGPRWFKLGERKVAYKRSDVEAWLEAQYAGANDPSSVA